MIKIKLFMSCLVICLLLIFINIEQRTSKTVLQQQFLERAALKSVKRNKLKDVKGILKIEKLVPEIVIKGDDEGYGLIKIRESSEFNQIGQTIVSGNDRTSLKKIKQIKEHNVIEIKIGNNNYYYKLTSKEYIRNDQLIKSVLSSTADYNELVLVIACSKQRILLVKAQQII